MYFIKRCCNIIQGSVNGQQANKNILYDKKKIREYSYRKINIPLINNDTRWGPYRRGRCILSICNIYTLLTT